MSARLHLRPAPEVRVYARHPRARRVQDLLREGGVGRRRRHGLLGRDRPRRVVARVVGPEGRVDGAGDPVEHHVRQQRVLVEASLDVSVAIAPRAELLDDPRGEPHRRVGQPVRQRLRLRALDRLVAGLLAQPVIQLLEVRALVRRRCRSGRAAVARHRQEVDVDADELVGVRGAQVRRHEGAPVTALRGEARVAEHVGHERGEEVGHLRHAEARLVRLERERVARQRRRDDGERVSRIAAEARRIGQHRDQPPEFDDRARPAVREQQRHRARPHPGLVDEVQVDAAQRHGELPARVELHLLRAPVVAVAPVADERLHVGEVGAVAPRLAGDLVGPAHARQARAQVVEHGVGHADGERAGRHGRRL